ncbi:MAG TPA: hypothetical protein VGN52_00545 [Burkholderiales bacterium]|jgi:Zn-dependent protease
MQGNWRIARWRGVPVYVNWSAIFIVPVLMMFGHSLQGAILALPGYALLILAHEAGHAWVAQRLGTPVLGIELHCIHGLCRHETPYYEHEDFFIAWGGVAAQALLLAIAWPLWWMSGFAPAGPANLLRMMLVMLVWGNMMTMAFNLLPVPGLDGAKAWRALPYGWEWLRGRIRRARKCGASRKKRLRVVPPAQPDMAQQMREVPEETASVEAAAAASELLERLKGR